MTMAGANTLPDTPETRDYNRQRRWLEIGDLVMSFGFLIVLLATGWTKTLSGLATRMGRDHYALDLFYYVLFLSVISKVLGFALDFYGFRLEHRFNLSNQRLFSWLKDELKSWVIGLVFTVVLAEIVYAVIRISPPYWWILAWLVFVPITLFIARIVPVIIAPLFYKFVPLENEALKIRLTRLSERAGTRVRGVYEWKLSEKSKKANAALAGLGNTRRIFIADTLLRDYSDDEIEAVLAHELGHHVHRHIIKMIAVYGLVYLAGFWAASEVLRYAIDEQHMFQHMADFSNLPLLGIVGSGLWLLLTPALNAYERFTERQADLYCWKCVSDVTPYITAMEKLARQNLSESHPSRLVELLFHSHPPISKRIAAAEAWAKSHRPSLAT